MVASASTSACLTFEKRELFLEGLDLEEEDVAAGFARALSPWQIASAGIVRDEVAGSDVQIFQEQRVLPRHRGRATGKAQRHDSFGAASDTIDEIEALDAEVVVGFNLDVHLLETRDAPVAGRLGDVHFRGAILDHPNEVLRVPCTLQPLGVNERDSIGVVLRDLQGSRQAPVRPNQKVDRGAGTEHQATTGRWPIRVDTNTDLSAGWRVDIAAVLFEAGREAKRLGIAVFDVDPLDARWLDHIDCERGRRDRTD